MINKLLAFTVALATCAYSKTEGGYIFSGLDTICGGTTTVQFFDMINDTHPPRYFDNELYVHMQLGSSRFGYGIEWSTVGLNALFKYMGKVNFDSVKFAPPDSEMVLDAGLGPEVFLRSEITQEKLNDLVGMVFCCKCGPMHQPYDGNFYYKIKIVSADLEIPAPGDSIARIGFLRALQLSGGNDLQTEGLDTFNLKPVSNTRPEVQRPYHSDKISRNKQPVFSTNTSVINNQLPSACYDLRGRQIIGTDGRIRYWPNVIK